jgi:hypothetical protein
MIKDIKNYEGIYCVDIYGNVYSYPKRTRKGFRKLKPTLINNGYLQVDLCKDFKIKKYSVHRLIAETFIDNKELKPQVNHINGIKTDNSLENLEWVTRSENQLHSIAIGLRSAKGEKNSQSKLTNKIVLDIFKDKRMYKEISKDFDISISTISGIKVGHSWSHVTGIKKIKKSGNQKQILYIK